MNVVQALPRRMRFDAQAASSVELCVAEWVSGSRHRATTTVAAERSDAPPLLDVTTLRLAPAPRLASWHLAWSLRRHAARTGTDVIVTQQHVVTAGRIARLNPRLPVVLQTHNFVDPPATGPGAARRNRAQRQALQRLAGITLISEATRRRFEADWPEVTIPRAVVTNGFDFRQWQPAAERDQRILVVGRMVPEKGIFEAAQGCARFLADHPGWGADFVLSEGDPASGYGAAVRAAIAEAGGRITLAQGIPFAAVKQMAERAAVALVPSRWEEPFGRTALEAHAGGAALVSSGTGGLAEISGEAALIAAPDPVPIADALARLAGDQPLRRQLADDGAERVRRLFPLTAAAAGGAEHATPVCERFDAFLGEVLTAWRAR